MLTVFRSQVDPEELVIPDPRSIEIDCSGDPLITRQEQKADADVNRVLSRYMASGRLPDLREGAGGFIDYDADLSSLLQARDSIRDSYASLSAVQRERYPTLEAYYAAVTQLSLDLSDPAPKRRAEDGPRDRRSSDKAAAEQARFDRAVDAAAAKRSAAGA